MAEMFPESDYLEELVRQQFEEKEREVDSVAFAKRVQLQLNPARPHRRTSLVRVVATLTTMTAAAVAFAFFLFISKPGVVSAEQLFEEARLELAQPIDRCYQIETIWHSGLFKRFPWLNPKKPGKLWTRGDAFVMEMESPLNHAVWGRDEAGHVWVALGKQRGLLFDPDELDDGVTLVADLFTMRLETMLDEFPKMFDLQREVVVDQPHRIRFTATPPAGRNNPRLKRAVLEIDSRTKLVESLKIERLIRGEHVATISFTLSESTPQTSDRYQLQSNLDADARIHGPDQKLIRGALWKKWQERRKGE
jgi:hypothetical protein